MNAFDSAMADRIAIKRQDAVDKAIDNLARHKHSNFGYWAASAVHYNQLLEGTPLHWRRSPFRRLVDCARDMVG